MRANQKRRKRMVESNIERILFIECFDFGVFWLFFCGCCKWDSIYYRFYVCLLSTVQKRNIHSNKDLCLFSVTYSMWNSFWLKATWHNSEGIGVCCHQDEVCCLPSTTRPDTKCLWATRTHCKKKKKKKSSQTFILEWEPEVDYSGQLRIRKRVGDLSHFKNILKTTQR